jgi:hypothetical protein
MEVVDLKGRGNAGKERAKTQTTLSIGQRKTSSFVLNTIANSIWHVLGCWSSEQWYCGQASAAASGPVPERMLNHQVCDLTTSVPLHSLKSLAVYILALFIVSLLFFIILI